MVTIWFESHATTLDNEQKLASGWYDVDLSERGHKEAQELAKRCASRNIQVVFSSDLQRAVKTVQPFVAQANVPFYTDERLRECNYGDLTRHSKTEIDNLRFTRVSDSYPNGESYTDCLKRVVEFLCELKANFDGKTVLIVGHRATQYGLENRINRKPLPEVARQKWTWQPGWKYELK
jgi:broad specificity phosphatase PhoE